MKDIVMIILIVFTAFILALLITSTLYMNEIMDLTTENLELKTQNERLEKIIKELDREQAEQTKRTAERNGVGG